MEELADMHGKPWGGGEVVDPDGWSVNVNLARKFTQGKAPSILVKKKKKVSEALRAKYSKQQLKRIVREAPTPYEREEALEFLRQDTGQRHTAMGATAKSDELFDARDNLLGLIELLEPAELEVYIDSLIDELEMMKQGV